MYTVIGTYKVEPFRFIPGKPLGYGQASRLDILVRQRNRAYIVAQIFPCLFRTLRVLAIVNPVVYKFSRRVPAKLCFYRVRFGRQGRRGHIPYLVTDRSPKIAVLLPDNQLMNCTTFRKMELPTIRYKAPYLARDCQRKSRRRLRPTTGWAPSLTSSDGNIAYSLPSLLRNIL